MKNNSLITLLTILILSCFSLSQDVRHFEPIIVKVPVNTNLLTGDITGQYFDVTIKGTVFVMCAFNNGILTDKTALPDNVLVSWSNDRIKLAWPNVKSMNDFMADLRMMSHVEDGSNLKSCKFQVMRGDNMKTNWK